MNTTKPLDSERGQPETQRHGFVGQYGLGNKFCAFPVGMYRCGQPREAEIHKLPVFETANTGPCSACGDGDTALRYHSHGEPPHRSEVAPERCEFTCHDPSYKSMCKVAHRCVLEKGHPLRDDWKGSGHSPFDFEGHGDTRDDIAHASAVEVITAQRDKWEVLARQFKGIEYIKVDAANEILKLLKP